MKLIRNTVFETNSSSVHTLTLISLEQEDDHDGGPWVSPDKENRFNKDIDMSSYRDKEYIYTEHSYDRSEDIRGLENKLSLVCDYLVIKDNLDNFINYLKTNYNITILINSKFKLKGKSNNISPYEYLENYNNDEDYNELGFDELTLDQFTKFIFGNFYIKVYIGSDNW